MLGCVCVEIGKTIKSSRCWSVESLNEPPNPSLSMMPMGKKRVAAQTRDDKQERKGRLERSSGEGKGLKSNKAATHCRHWNVRL